MLCTTRITLFFHILMSSSILRVLLYTEIRSLPMWWKEILQFQWRRLPEVSFAEIGEILIEGYFEFAAHV